MVMATARKTRTKAADKELVGTMKFHLVGKSAVTEAVASFRKDEDGKITASVIATGTGKKFPNFPLGSGDMLLASPGLVLDKDDAPTKFCKTEQTSRVPFDPPQFAEDGKEKKHEVPNGTFRYCANLPVDIPGLFGTLTFGWKDEVAEDGAGRMVATAQFGTGGRAVLVDPLTLLG